MTSPAGWYPDPEQAAGAGRPTLRWWDGSGWTDDRAPAPDPSLAPGPLQQAQQQPQYGAYPSTGGGFSSAPPVPGAYGGYGGKPTTTPAGEPLAGLGARLGARIIDWILVAVVSALASIPFYPGIFRAVGDYLDEVAADPDTDPFTLYRDPEFLVNAGLATLVGLVVGALYEVVFLRVRAATPGKLALGLRVRRWEAPHGGAQARLGWGTAVGRWATQNLPTQLLPFWNLVDSLWCTWDGRRQTLHDKVVGTTVVSIRR